MLRRQTVSAFYLSSIIDWFAQVGPQQTSHLDEHHPRSNCHSGSGHNSPAALGYVCPDLCDLSKLHDKYSNVRLHSNADHHDHS
jgi:hypothetical protein